MLIRMLGRAGLLLLPAAILCAVWEWAAWESVRTQFLFGSPSLVGKHLWRYLWSGDAPIDLLITGGEAFAGFLAGNVVGMVLGLGLAYSPRLQYVARPYVVIMGSIPIFALAPMMIMWFGVGYFAKVMMAILSTFLVTTVQAYTGATSADPELIELLRSFNASRFEVFKKVVFPSSLEWVVSSFRLTVGFALLGAFIGEFISAERGLGFRILKSGGLFDIPGVIAGVVLIAALALALTKGVDLLSRYVLRWRQDEASSWFGMGK
jgi:NitT/TauT family transport system permease protein